MNFEDNNIDYKLKILKIWQDIHGCPIFKVACYQQGKVDNSKKKFFIKLNFFQENFGVFF